ncbi:MAG: hypothetical protein ACLQNE_35170 [Thermoguttaceae bacterium]
MLVRKDQGLLDNVFRLLSVLYDTQCRHHRDALVADNQLLVGKDIAFLDAINQH